MDAAEWKATLERMVESLEREAQAKREELADIETSIAGARSMLKLPLSVLNNALPLAGTATTPSGEVTLASALRGALEAQTGQFTNAKVFALMNERYPGVFKKDQIGSVSSIMAKYHGKGVIRQVSASPGMQTVWEKVPGTQD
ncbi:MAG: hypothetical protein QOH06_1030 [Acidobacteriota bacterium]|nr:hypothetical protein [Acidobacteriota bacterium]